MIMLKALACSNLGFDFHVQTQSLPLQAPKPPIGTKQAQAQLLWGCIKETVLLSGRSPSTPRHSCAARRGGWQCLGQPLARLGCSREGGKGPSGLGPRTGQLLGEDGVEGGERVLQQLRQHAPQQPGRRRARLGRDARLRGTL